MLEPTARPLDVRVAYVINTTVQKLERKSVEHWVKGTAEAAEFSTEYLGWYIQFEGSLESVCLGNDKPPFAPGDRVKITITKVEDNAKSG